MWAQKTRAYTWDAACERTSEEQFRRQSRTAVSNANSYRFEKIYGIVFVAVVFWAMRLYK